MNFTFRPIALAALVASLLVAGPAGVMDTHVHDLVIEEFSCDYCGHSPVGHTAEAPDPHEFDGTRSDQGVVYSPYPPKVTILSRRPRGPPTLRC